MSEKQPKMAPKKASSQKTQLLKTPDDDYLSSRIAGSGSFQDKALGLVAILSLLATWFLGVFYPIVVLVLWYFGLKTLLSAFLVVSLGSYAYPFEQSPTFVRFLLKMPYWFEHSTMHVEPEVEEALKDSASMWCLHPVRNLRLSSRRGVYSCLDSKSHFALPFLISCPPLSHPLPDT